MPRRNFIHETKKQQNRKKNFILTNGIPSSDKLHCYALNKEEASICNLFAEKMKLNCNSSEVIEFQLEGASNQNIQDLGEFFVLCKGKREKCKLKHPIRSSTDANETILEPSWAGGFANRLLKHSTLKQLLVLMYCATGLNLPTLEQICLVCVAMHMKGKTIQDLNGMIQQL